MLRRSTLALALAPSFVLIALPALAGEPPSYNLVPIEVPQTSSVYVADLSDGGVAVGYALETDTFNAVPFVWSGGVAQRLAIPANRVEGYATGINAQGLIVGYASLITKDGAETTALLWNAASPGQFVEMDGPSGVSMNGEDLNNAGLVVGLAAEDGQFNAFQWTADGGFVDDGVPPNGPGTQAYWSGVNNQGAKVGGWNFPGSATHATIGQAGTPGIQPIAAGVNEVASRAVAINDAGTAVGEMDLAANGLPQPVVFENNAARAIPGALLGLPQGSASDINASGTIVGRALDFNKFLFKAFVHLDGVSYDIAEQATNPEAFEYLLNGVAVNASGAIAGTARGPDFTVASFMALPAGAGGDRSVAITGPSSYMQGSVVPITVRAEGTDSADLAGATLRIRVDARSSQVAIQAPSGWQCAALAGRTFASDCTPTDAPSTSAAAFDLSVSTGGRPNTFAFTVEAVISGSGADDVPANDRAAHGARLVRSLPAESSR